ncbi:MAG: DUF2231 domain-containing protein [Luteimonas sp.]
MPAPASRLLRHPLHPALVHFPIACWTAVPVLDLLYLVLHTPLWWGCSYWVLAIGNVIALAAMAAGLFDLMRLSRDHPGQRPAQRHMLLMGSAWTVFLFDMLLRSPHQLPSPTMGWLGFALSVSGFAVLLVGAWTGAELVYKYGVGQAQRM